jgi:hypothetical protein
MTKTPAAIEKMIGFYEGSLHDINHFLKVYAYAETIGRLEGLDAADLETLELAAVVHDIACPLCRAKYGNAAAGFRRRRAARSPRVSSRSSAARSPSSRGSAISWRIIIPIRMWTGRITAFCSKPTFSSMPTKAGCPQRPYKKAKDAFFRTAPGLRLLRAVYNI